jgi:opacity protein-like surface antigen
MRGVAYRCCAAVGGAAILFTSSVLAQNGAPPFGERGEFVATGSSVMAISWTWWEASDAWAYALTIAPALDLFVARNVSLGVGLQFGYVENDHYGADGSLVETDSTTFSGAVRLGVNVPIATEVSWYPQLAVGFESLRSEERLESGRSRSVADSPLGASESRQDGPWIEFFAPLLFHPRPHFFVGLGPDIFHDFGAVRGGPNVGGQRTSLGIGVVMGTWWGGPASSAGAQQTALTQSRRFGEAHEVVLSSEAAAGANWTTYAGVPSESTIVTFAPGVDYFVTRHVSVGAALAIRSTRVTGIDATTTLPVTSHEGGYTGMLRVGVDLPMTAWLSFYPRAGVSGGVVTHDEKSGDGQNRYNENVISVGIYAPLLLHVAPHAFFGFGPALSRDLYRAIQHSNVENRTTSAGAGLIVGGWID